MPHAPHAKPNRAIMVLLGVWLCSSVGGFARAEESTAVAETKAHREARLAWWKEARFGMFIHWGIYSIPAEGEWMMSNTRTPVATYAQYATQFNPTHFDAEQWALTAQAAGMKYLIITAKHHDGFAMFASKVSSYNIVDATPFKRDPLKELAAACTKHGLKLGFYYSQSQDWHSPGGQKAVGGWDKAQDGDYDTYLRTIAVPQVTELLSNYGPGIPAILWFDTPSKMTHERVMAFVPALALQPALICNNRLGDGVGDYGTPEGFIPPTSTPGSDWETCMTMNDSWGYSAKDDKWKDASVLVRQLIETVSKGGNYLLNVGPTSEGLIPAPSIARLKRVGAWMAIYHDSIYGAGESPFITLPWGMCTQKRGKIYLHVFQWPSDGRLDVPMAGNAQQAYLLCQPAIRLPMARNAHGGQSITVGAIAPDDIASVVVIEYAGEVLPVSSVVAQAADGALTLSASTANVSGPSLGLEHGTPPNLGFWSGAADTAYWQMIIDKPGTFDVSILASLLGGGGDAFTISAAGQTVVGTSASTKGWGDYVAMDVGTLTIATHGPVLLRIKPVKQPHGALMNLRTITLTPVP